MKWQESQTASHVFIALLHYLVCLSSILTALTIKLIRRCGRTSCVWKNLKKLVRITNSFQVLEEQQTLNDSGNRAPWQIFAQISNRKCFAWIQYVPERYLRVMSKFPVFALVIASRSTNSLERKNDFSLRNWFLSAASFPQASKRLIRLKSLMGRKNFQKCGARRMIQNWQKNLKWQQNSIQKTRLESFCGLFDIPNFTNPYIVTTCGEPDTTDLCDNVHHREPWLPERSWQ